MEFEENMKSKIKPNKGNYFFKKNVVFKFRQEDEITIYSLEKMCVIKNRD